jgi:hypothetical protein
VLRKLANFKALLQFIIFFRGQGKEDGMLKNIMRANEIDKVCITEKPIRISFPPL